MIVITNVQRIRIILALLVLVEGCAIKHTFETKELSHVPIEVTEFIQSFTNDKKVLIKSNANEINSEEQLSFIAKGSHQEEGIVEFIFTCSFREHAGKLIASGPFDYVITKVEYDGKHEFREIGFFEDNCLSGSHCYFMDGSMLKMEFFEDTLLYGSRLFFNPENGELLSCDNYIANKKDGCSINFKDRSIESVLRFKDSEKCGYFNIFDKFGGITFQSRYNCDLTFVNVVAPDSISCRSSDGKLFSWKTELNSWQIEYLFKEISKTQIGDSIDIHLINREVLFRDNNKYFSVGFD